MQLGFGVTVNNFSSFGSQGSTICFIIEKRGKVELSIYLNKNLCVFLKPGHLSGGR